jgi:IS30 family transposase|tara:strand:+ start:287 stop:598 length:312 start_codon:yes stop_codon:yes gene_type:complete
MKKGKLTEVEIACIKGMLAAGVSNEDMAKQLNRSSGLVKKEAERISEDNSRDQMIIKKTAKGEGGIVAMTEAGSLKSDKTDKATPPSDSSRERGKWVHTIYGD